MLILIGSYNANIQEDGPSIKKTIISSFDTLTNKAAVIKDNIDGALRSAFMHRGTIYYALNHSDGADVHALYKIEGDGSGYEEIDIDGKDYLSVYTIRDGTVYYYSDDPEDDCVYTCDLDFKNHKKLFEGGYLRDVTDEYIYYIANIDAEKKTCELCRRALDDISKEEVILPEIPSSGCSVNDGKAYIFGEGYASLTEYDLESGKSRIIFEGEKECDAAPKRVDIDNGRMILEKFAEWYIVIELEKGEVRYIPVSK